MNKRGLWGKITVVVIALLLIVGTIVYLTGSFSFSPLKDVDVEISYNPDEVSENTIKNGIIEVAPEEKNSSNETNFTSLNSSNVILENNNSYIANQPNK